MASGSQLIIDNAHVRFDVARGLAAGAVFGDHLWLALFLRLSGNGGLLQGIITTFGRHAVLVFFLLSGHLITKSIISNIRRNGQFDASEYMLARITRIYPPLLGSIVLVSLIWFVIHFLNLPGSSSYGVDGDLYRIRDAYTMSIAEVIDALTMSNGLLYVNGPLWSLFVEFHIYIIALAVAVWWQNNRVLTVCAALLGMVALSYSLDQFFLIGVWLLGALSAIYPLGRKVNSIVLICSALSVAAVLAARPDLFFPLAETQAGYAVQFVCCLIYCGLLFFQQSDIRYPRFLIATGGFSYSLYIVHFPILLLTLSFGQNWMGHSFVRTLIVAMISFPSMRFRNLIFENI